MKTAHAVAALMIVTTMQAVQLAPAKDRPTYERGVLLQMDSTHCGYAERDNKTVAGEIFGYRAQFENRVLGCAVHGYTVF